MPMMPAVWRNKKATVVIIPLKSIHDTRFWTYALKQKYTARVVGKRAYVSVMPKLPDRYVEPT